MRKTIKAFTLLELLMVIIVIAVLISIVLPRFSGLVDTGNITKAKGELRTLQTAVESYYMHNDHVYPTALSQLTTQTPQIVITLPKDPFNPGSDYGYSVGGSNNKIYVIYSIGPGAGGIASIVAQSGYGEDSVSETSSDVIYVSNAAQDTAP